MSDEDAKLGDVISYGLVANFVHQVINPLNGVAGTLENLVEGVIPPDRAQQRTRAARAQLEQAILLLRNLAFFTELSGDQPESANRRVRKVCVIPQIIIEAAMFFQELAAMKGMKLELEDRETQYRVEGNPDLLRQVFMNLFDNAVKYGQSDTTVYITPWVQKQINALLIRVSGISLHIPGRERELIFNLGYRSPAAQDKIASGTGLGLSICRTILKVVHGASIEVQSSSPNGEVAFLLRFPSFTVRVRPKTS